MNPLILILSVLLVFTSPGISAQRRVKESTADSLRVETAICANDKYIWIGTNLGLIRHNIRTGKEWMLTEENSNLPSNVITCIVCLSDGQTYIGTTNGILIWDNYAFLVINTENSELPENYIREMFLDQQENIWILTKDCRMLKGIGRYIKRFRLWGTEKKDTGIIEAIKPDLPSSTIELQR